MISIPSIAMVNYLNSKPFVYGLINDIEVPEFEIITATPANCASLYLQNKADIALVPVGALNEMEDYTIISDFCIGCDGEVRTVCIFSNDRLEDCSRLLQDTHSRTSVLLSRLILENYLGYSMTYQSLNIPDYRTQSGEAVLMIGDKVFEYEKSFKYKYDLGKMWKDWTGLPFVFAVWIARVDKISEEIIQKLNHAFEYGVTHLPQVIQQESNSGLDLYYYFSHNIQYVLDNQKKIALDLFLQKTKPYILHPGIS